MRLSKVQDQFIEQCRADKMSPATIISYESTLRQFVVVVVGSKDDLVSNFNEDTVAAYFRKFAERDNGIGTLGKKKAVLKSFARYCLRRRYLPYDPMLGVAKYRVPEAPPKFYSTRERQRLMALTELEKPVRRRLPDGTRTKDLWERVPLTPAQILARELLYHTGLRVGTVVQLQWKHLDLQGEMGEITTVTKGGKTINVPVVPELGRQLVAFLEAGHSDGAPTTYLFAGPQGAPWSVRTLQRIVTGMGRAAAIAKATPHRFRHTVGKEMMETHATLEETQRMLGHADITTTQIYRKIVDAQVVAAAQRRSKLLAEVEAR